VYRAAKRKTLYVIMGKIPETEGRGVAVYMPSEMVRTWGACLDWPTLNWHVIPPGYTPADLLKLYI